LLSRAAGLRARFGARSPEEIRAYRVANRPARVLCEHQARHRRSARRERGGEEHRRPERNVARIDGNRASRKQRHAERPDRTASRVGQGQLSKEHEARVLVEKVLHPLWVGRRPGLDRLHRGFAELELASVDEEASDRLKRVAVLVGVADPKRLAVGQLHSSGSLYLEKERFDRVVDPEDFLAGDGSRAAGDFRARVVGDYALALDAAPQAHSAQLRIRRGQVDGEQIVGRTVDRIHERGRFGAAAAQERLVVAGNQSVECAVGIRNTPGNELLFEEAARLLVAGRAKLRRFRTDAPPCVPEPQRLAGREKGRPSCGLLAVVPARDRREIDDLERIDALRCRRRRGADRTNRAPGERAAIPDHRAHRPKLAHAAGEKHHRGHD